MGSGDTDAGFHYAKVLAVLESLLAWRVSDKLSVL